MGKPKLLLILIRMEKLPFLKYRNGDRRDEEMHYGICSKWPKDYL